MLCKSMSAVYVSTGTALVLHCGGITHHLPMLTRTQLSTTYISSFAVTAIKIGMWCKLKSFSRPVLWSQASCVTGVY